MNLRAQPTKNASAIFVGFFMPGLCLLTDWNVSPMATASAEISARPHPDHPHPPTTESVSPAASLAETPTPAAVDPVAFAASPQDHAMLEFSEKQNGSRVALIVNDRIRIAIDGNPTTGYLWETDHLDSNLLEQEEKTRFAPSDGLKGAAGNFVFRFKALRTGMTRLRLVYRRPFEKNVPPDRRYELTVEIR